MKVTAFQTAVELSERGNQEDTAKNYAKALSLYEAALEYYLAALKGIEACKRYVALTIVQRSPILI